MHLSNYQYERFEKEYKALQAKRESIIRERLAHLRRAVPGYSDLEDEISDLGFDGVRRLLSAQTDNGYSRAGFNSSIEDLKAQKQRLITDAGYPADYLDPPYTCDICRDTGYLGRDKCRCFVRKITDYLYDQSNLGQELNIENFDTLSFEYHRDRDLDRYRDNVETARRFVSDFPNGRNMLFYGTVGTGKTFLSKCVTKAVIDKGYSALYYSAPSLIDHLAGRVVDDEGRPLDLYCFDLIIIDDLGTENPNDYTKALLYEFLNRRLTAHQSLIISTNKDLAGIQEMYTDRIFSRFVKFFDVRMFTGNDIRIDSKFPVSS